MTEIVWPCNRIAMWQEGQTFLRWFCNGAIYGRKMECIANTDIQFESIGSFMYHDLSGHKSNAHNHSLMEFGLIWK